MLLRPVLRWLRRLSLLLLLALVALYLLRDRILAQPLAGLVADQLSAALGGKFTVERVEGTYFTNLRLIGLRTVEAPTEGPLARLDFARAEAEFSLFRLRLDAVRIEGLVAEVDLDRPSEPSDEPLDLGTLPAFPQVALDGRVAVSAGGRRFSVDRVRLSGDGRTFDLHTEGIDLAGEVTAESFGGRIERTAPDTILWTSESELRGARPRRIEIRLAGAVDAHAQLDYGGGVVEARYADDGAHVTISKLRVREDIVVEALEAAIDPAAGAATVTTLDATIAGGHAHVRNARVEFGHPFFVTRLDALSVDIPDLHALLRDHEQLAASVSLRAALTDGVMRVSRLSLRKGHTSLEFQGSATLPPDPERWLETAIDATLQGTLDARTLPSDPDLPAMEGAVAIDGTLGGTLRSPTGALSVVGSELVVAGQTIRKLEGKGELAYPHLTVSSLVFDADPGRLTVSGKADLSARTLEDGAYDLDLRDLQALATMIPGAPAMEGSLRGRGRLAFGETRRGHLELEGAGLVFEGIPVDEFALEAKIDESAFELTRLVARAEAWELEASGDGSLDGRTAALRRLDARFGERRFELSAPMPIAWSAASVSFRDLDARVLGGRLRGHGSFGDRIDLDLRAEGLQVLEGVVDAAVRAAGTADAPLVSIEAKAPRIVWNGHAAAFELRARQEAERIVVETLHLDGGDALSVKADARWPVVVGRQGVRHTEAKPHLALSAHAVFEEFAEDLPAGLAFQRLDLTARVDGLDAEAECLVRDLQWTSEAKVVLPGETRIHVLGRTDHMVATVRTPDGSPIETEATVRSPVGIDWSKAQETVDRLLDSTVEGTADLRLVDLSPIGRFEASPIADVRGSARVKVKLGGRVRAPSLEGEATIDCPQLRLKADVPSFQDLEGTVRFDHQEIRVESIRARLGYAPIEVKGTLRPDRIDLSIQGTNVLLARTPYLRLRSDVDIAVTGPIESLDVKGSIDITDALYSEPIKLLSQSGASADTAVQLFHLRGGPLSTMKLDLAVRAKETIRIDNNVVQGRISADLRIGGTGAVPVQEGRLDFRDLRFTFPVTAERLLVEQGAIVFARDDPFDPQVRLRGEKRKLGYDLTVTVLGKASALEVYITSTPALPREEAYLLLTAGTLSENIAESGAYTAGLFAGRSILEKVFGPTDPDEESIIDRFEVETGRDVSPQGDPTIEARFRVSKAERWYAIGERDRWGDYNGGLMLRFRFK